MSIVVWLTLPAVILGLTAAAEIAARWWLRHRTHYYVLAPGLRLRLRPDPEVFPQLEQVVRFDVNGAGERGDDLPRRPGRLCRMLVLGGSQPEGYLLDQHTTWPGALQRLLESPVHRARLGCERVHVGSIARSGVGSEALDLILERVLPRYPRLHTIIILVGASDVLRWLEVGAPPSAPPPVRTGDVFQCHPEVVCGWRLRHLALIELLRRLRMRVLRPIDENDHACRWIGRARAMRARAKEIRTMPDPAPMLAHFDLHFRRALGRAKAHAARVIVVRQPWFGPPHTPEEAAQMWHGGAGKAWREAVTTFYSLDVLARLMALVDARASRIAQELEIEQLDLLASLDRGLETYYDSFHATPAGARIVAASVAAAILRRPAQSIDPDPRLTAAVDRPVELHQKVS